MQGNSPIIYVTSDWSGLKDIIKNKDSTPKGMPAFFKPLEALDQKGINVELVILTNSFTQLEVNCNYFKNINITVLDWPTSKSLSAITTIFKAVYKVYSLIKAKEASFVYALGPKGVTGMLAAKLAKVPVGVRVFGINTYYEKFEERGIFKFFLLSPLMFLLFRLRSRFLLATDDGSPADKLNDAIGNRKNNFLHWPNGFDEVSESIEIKQTSERYLIYPSRISKKKQQLEAVKLLYELNKLGHTDVNLYFVGHMTDETYWQSIEGYAQKKGLESRVKYAGLMNKATLYSAMKGAMVVLSLQKVSNLSNVLLEALSCGSLVLSFKEPALNRFLKNNESAILVDEIKEGSEYISSLINAPDKAQIIRANGKKALQECFDNWDERVSKEVELLMVNSVSKSVSL